MAISKDKVAHAAACYGAIIIACFVGLINSAWMPYALCVGVGLSGGLAIGKEYGDYCASKTWNWKDLLADGAGALIGIIVGICMVIFK